MTIFTLPYLNFEIERNALRAVCAEKNKTTYLTQHTLAPKNCLLNHGYASKVMRSVDLKYDFIFLDMCGAISQEMIDCIMQAKDYMKPGASIALTVLRAREHPKWHKIINPKSRVKDFIRLFRYSGLYVNKIIRYYDTSPMMVIIASDSITKIEFLTVK